MRKDARLRKFGVLTADGKFLRQYEESGKKVLSLEGVYHHNMVTRSTNENYKLKFPTYRDVTLCPKFQNFQYFAEWCQSQVGFGNLGWVLDKDVVGTGKTYSEDNCVFVPTEINSYFVTYTKERDLPKGVSWCPSEDCYKAYCSQLNGKNKTLGRFDNIESAGKAHQDFKNNLANELILMFDSKVDQRVISKLKLCSSGGYTW